MMGHMKGLTMSQSNMMRKMMMGMSMREKHAMMKMHGKM